MVDVFMPEPIRYTEEPPEAKVHAFLEFVPHGVKMWVQTHSAKVPVLTLRPDGRVSFEELGALQKEALAAAGFPVCVAPNPPHMSGARGWRLEAVSNGRRLLADMSSETEVRRILEIEPESPVGPGPVFTEPEA